MINQKVILVTYKSETAWDSCKDINNGLISLYEKIFNNITFYSASDDSNSGEELLNLVNKLKPNKLIFVDHRIRLNKELHFINKELSNQLKSQIHFIFHVFGCFINRINEWSYIQKYFKDYTVDFVAGSSAHQGLVEKVLLTRSKPLCLPFPVEDKKFKNLKLITKSELGFKDSDKLLLYVGRVSPGKNVIPLCRLVGELNKSQKERIHLVIVGSIDDMGWPESGSWARRGAMCFHFAQTIESINKDYKCIHYFSHIEDKSKLYGLYKCSDLIVSLSTMLNEDYGMAIADAVGLNKKVVCTNWGGYREISSHSENVYTSNVEIVGDQIKVDLEDVKQKIIKALNAKINKYKNELSVETLWEDYSDALEKSESQIIEVTKMGKALSLYNYYGVLKDKLMRRLYETYWL